MMVGLMWALGIARASSQHLPGTMWSVHPHCRSGGRSGTILLRAESSWESWKDVHALVCVGGCT